MKTLIVHHLEMLWEQGYRKCGTTFNRLCEQTADHINNEDYDKVILTKFEDDKLESEHYYTGLAYLVNEIYVYGYGWTIDDVDCAINWTKGGSHSDYVWIAP